MFPDWLFLAVFAGLGSNLYNFFNRVVLKDDGDSLAYAWWTEFLRFGIALIFVSFDFSVILSLHTVFLLFLVGVVEVVSSFIFYKMHRYNELSISTIISRTRLIWIPIIAFFFLGEKLSIVEYVGIIILFLGLSIAVSPHRLRIDKGIQLAYLSALVVAVLSIVMKAGSSQVSTSILLIFMSVTSVIVFPLFMKSPKKRIITIFKKNPLKILAASGFNIIAMYLYVLALRLGDVSKVTAIYQGMMIVSIIFGIVLLKEKKDVVKKVIGATITIVGVSILAIK